MSSSLAAPRTSILIVDDRDENLFALEVALEPLGQRIVRARSGQDALLAVLGETFAVILMDIRMPGMDGFETLAMLRTRERSRHIPVIFLTAFPDKQDLPRSDKHGAVDCMSKPIDPEALRAKVAVFVHLRQTELALQQARDQLEFRVAERTRELADANASLEREIARRAVIEAQLVEQAHRDALTGLANRKLLLEHLQRALARRQRQPTARFAVLLLDLDRFKPVNDTHGHLAGDRLLREVSARLEKCLRAVDTAARLGGDEFAVLVDQLDETGRAAERIAARIHEALAAPIAVSDGTPPIEVSVSASIGIAHASDRHLRAADLLRDADAALYRAKDLGRARTEVFDQAMHDRVVAQLRDEAELGTALERGDLRVVYQPIVRLATGAVAGFEARVVWHHPTRGIVEPAHFLPIAEDTGLAPAIGTHALAETCAQLAAWRAEGHDVRVGVDITAAQLARPGFAAHVQALCRDHAIAPDALELELGEAVLLAATEATLGELGKLRAAGAGIAIESFGTGFSRIATLHELAVTTLKMDRRVVASIGEAADRPSVARAIASLAQGLGTRLVAEGIETSAQVARLTLLGCEYGQGTYFSAALDGAEAGRLLATREVAIAPSSRVTMR